MPNALFDDRYIRRDDGMISVAKLSQLVPGQLRRIVVNGQPIILVLRKVDNSMTPYRVAAFGALCPHAMGDLSQGWLTGDELDCPVHYYQFSVVSGECTSPKGGPKLRLYPVIIEGDLILLKVTAPRWMDQTDM